MNKLSDLKPYIRETLALQDIFLSLGHEQDDLFVIFDGRAASVSILKNGLHHPFPAALPPPGLTKETFQTEFKEACLAWNQASQEERHQLVEESDVRKRAVHIVANLVAQDLNPIKEIDFPCPFCGGHVHADGLEGSTGHTTPPCSKFQNLEPMAFLKACRHEMTGN